MDVQTQLGMRIKYLRECKGWTQEKLSFESGVNKNYLSDLERGRRNPSLNILERIAIAFNITLSELTKGIMSFR